MAETRTALEVAYDVLAGLDDETFAAFDSALDGRSSD
jgi:hypothetical protein